MGGSFILTETFLYTYKTKMILSLLVKENIIIFMNIKDWLGMMEM